jgi:hypothetical protein
MMEMDQKTIDVLLRDYESDHTEYQIKNFIVGSEVHPWHQYKQCLREIAARHDNLKTKTENLKAIDEQRSRLKGRRLFFRKKRKIQIAKINEIRPRLLKSIGELNREVDCFVKIALEIRRKFGFERLSGEQKMVLESAAWREKAQYMICMDLFCIGRPSKQTIEFVYKLPKEVKRELFTKMMELNKDNVQHFLIEG